jgi:hypothetical protein
MLSSLIRPVLTCVPILILISLLVIAFIYFRTRKVEVTCYECEENGMFQKCKPGTGKGTETCTKYENTIKQINEIQDRLNKIGGEFQNIGNIIKSKIDESNAIIEREFTNLKNKLNDTLSKLDFFRVLFEFVKNLKIPTIDDLCNLLNINNSLDQLEKVFKIKIPRLLNHNQTDVCLIITNEIKPLLNNIITEIEKFTKKIFEQLVTDIQTKIVVPLTRDVGVIFGKALEPLDDIKLKFGDLNKIITEINTNDKFIEHVRLNFTNKFKELIGYNRIMFIGMILLAIILIGGCIGIITFIVNILYIPLSILFSLFMSLFDFGDGETGEASGDGSGDMNGDMTGAVSGDMTGVVSGEN